jgi:hypothetical protein
MRSRHCLAWGSVAALLSAAALAQQPETNPSRRDSATQPGRNTATQPATNPGRMTGLRSSDPKMILNDMDGVWRVEMRVNPEKFEHMNMRGHMDRGMHDGMDRDATNRDINRDANRDVNRDANRPGAQPTDRDNALNNERNQPNNNNNNLNNDRTQPNLINDPTRGMHNDLDRAMVLEGYCEKRWIMGGDILQETFVIPDIGAAWGDNDSARNMNDGENLRNANNDEGVQPSLENLESGRMLQTLCFLAFNEDNNTFDYVNMDSMQGKIKHATGTFDASTGVIEFDVRDVMGGGMDHGVNNPNRHMDPNYRDATREPGMIDNPNSRNQPGRPITPGADNTTGNRPGATGTDPSSPSTTNPAAVTPGSPQDRQPTNPDRATQPGREMDNDRMRQDRLEQDRLNQDRLNETRMYDLRGDSGENFKVVVEILSPDQHRISMYQDDAGRSGMTSPTSVNTPNTIRSTTTTTPSRTTTTTPGQNNQPNEVEGTPGFQPLPNPDQPVPAGSDPTPTTPDRDPGSTTNTTQPRTTTTPTTTTQPIRPATPIAGNSGFQSAYGTLVWQATYTRVDGAQASRYRQFLERADQLMQASVTDEGDDR